VFEGFIYTRVHIIEIVTSVVIPIVL